MKAKIHSIGSIMPGIRAGSAHHAEKPAFLSVGIHSKAGTI
jgi:hypothetical protein